MNTTRRRFIQMIGAAVALSRDQQTRIAQWLPEDLRWPEADSEDQDNAAV